MSTAQDLLHAMNILGVRLRVDDGKLILKAPKGLLTPEVMDMVHHLEPQLIDEVKWAQDASARIRISERGADAS